jgi:hemerythrin superfamily protein
MNAISLLIQDHREVSDLFDAFEEDDADKSGIAAQVCRMLTVHAMIEEELFYPAAREVLGDEGDDLLDEAQVEHASAKELIAQIEEEGQDGDLFEAKIKVLGEYVRHHVEEEEKELFPLVKKAEIDLEALGTELEQRKAALSAQFDGKSPAPASRASQSKVKAKQPGRS